MMTTLTFPYEDIELAYTVSGSGPALILLHGWPFHKASFRRLLPLLEPHYTCYALDAAGMGASGWSRHTNFTFQGHVERVRAFVDRMNLSRYSVIGHDTGGTFARMLAITDAPRVDKIVAIDTEVPGHLPGVVPRLQSLFRRRLGRALFKAALGSKPLMRRWLGRSGFFVDKRLLDDEYMELFVTSWLRSDQAFRGLLEYLLGVDHSLVARLDELHAKIGAPMLFIWGEKDGVFPVRRAREMVARIPDKASLAVIGGATFLPHEERPDEVAKHILAFLDASVPVRLATENR
ncbi:MAG: alpha/beta hydrolase [Parvibaculum sp.]|uniref:alpha/beta fold hydrolase n=1 Tax=Parvibaculum sp. TaxID=2024848 RepID=UPI0034A078EC